MADTVQHRHAATAAAASAIAVIALIIGSPLAMPAAAAATASQAVIELKAIELEKLAAMQSLLQRSEQCVRKASTMHALQQCHHQERQAQRQLHDQFHQRLAAIRERYGLPMPKPRPQDDDRRGASER